MRLGVLVVVGVSVVSSACIPRWNQIPIKTTAADFRTTFPPYLASGKDDPLALKSNWEGIDAACNVARAAMVREAEGISVRNKVISSLFSAAVGVLAVSSTLYAILDKTPKPEVTAILGLGAGVTTVPTFFFLGTDDREREVRAKVAILDSKRGVSSNMFAKLMSAISALDDTDREIKSLEEEQEREQKKPAPDAAAMKKLSDSLTESRRLELERLRSAKDAQDNLTSALFDLYEACQ